MIKLKVREQSMMYAKTKQTNMSRIEEELEKTINWLQKEIDRSSRDETGKQEMHRELEKKQRELEQIIEHKTKGAILRSKCRWHNEGEKNTKYFLNLEKRHCKNGVISQLKIDDDKFVTSDKDILNACESFYKNIYSSSVQRGDCKETQNIFFPKTNQNMLTPEDKEKCERLLTKEECLQALKDMSLNKTPGSDGLPVEFYKVFWSDISDHLLNALNYAYHKGQLSVSQKRGVIKLIPKKDTEPYHVKNWRPITLLNCDYKIAAKAIANRLRNVIPKIINNDQTGFLKGRFIGENIRLIDGIINHTESNKIPGLLLFLDFEKAFDTVEWPFIWKTLDSFNFGRSITNWIMLCYQNIESCVLNNGWASNFFALERGVRQGCPLSPYIFLLCVEILAERIRTNKDIEGIFIKGNEIKISQYADDTTLILNGSEKSLTSALHDLELFSTISGLKLNNKKTEARLWIGSNTYRVDQLCPEKNLKWIKDKTKSLGVWISTNPTISINENYRERFGIV